MTYEHLVKKAVLEMLQGWLWGELVAKWPCVERLLEAAAQADGTVVHDGTQTHWFSMRYCT
jgi:hypothetical protein